MATIRNLETFFERELAKLAAVQVESLEKPEGTFTKVLWVLLEFELARLAAVQVESLEKPEGTFTKVLALLDIVQL